MWYARYIEPERTLPHGRTKPEMFYKLTAAILVVLLLVLLLAANYHVVVTGSGTMIIRKEAMSLEDTYIDIRAWELKDFWAHPHITEALFRRGYSEFLGDVEKELQDLFGE